MDVSLWAPFAFRPCRYLDLDELKRAITPRTRMLVLNTPLNPVGKVFSRSELQSLADIVLFHPRMLVLSDEVYQHIVYDRVARPHLSIASLDGMFDRTVTLGSAGKSFSVTGWKVWGGGPYRFRAITERAKCLLRCMIVCLLVSLLSIVVLRRRTTTLRVQSLLSQ